jgi:hypothetical protein
MAFIKLQFKPGINRDQTNYSDEGGWWECDKIRFRSGYPEKLGGWISSTTNTYVGACRQMWNWITTYSDNLLALGTNVKLYIEVGGSYYDITPLRVTNPSMTTPNTNNCVFTTNTSRTVTITLAAVHNLDTGQYVTIAGVTGTVGGIPNSEINANHQVTVVDTLSFTITVTTAATSTVAGGGGTGITVYFELAPGYIIATYGYGWGVGTWGRDTWGLGTAQPVLLSQQDWWLDNFDNDLVANVRNGPIFYWERGALTDPSTALDTRSVPLSDIATAGGYDPNAVPTQAMQVMLSQQDKHLIAFGAVPFGSVDIDDFDPMLIRWADQDNPGQWTPTVTNSAGFIRLSRGSRIIRAMSTRQEILVWTDTHLYTLQFLGTTDVFGVQEYADNISIVSSRAIATAANITYWMGQDKFYAYTGRVETLPCTLRNHVFTNINLDQAPQIICGTNEQWNEIWWFYPTADSEWNNAYVIYNHLEKIWYYGTMERTGWLDSALRHYPLATNCTTAGANGKLYKHENGIDDDEIAMEAYIQSNDFDLGDGDQFMLTRRMIPDVGFNGSTANEPEATFEVRSRNFPGQPSVPSAEDSRSVIQTTVGVYTEQIFIRARARQMAIKVTSETLGVQWQLGAPRLDTRPDGRR